MNYSRNQELFEQNTQTVYELDNGFGFHSDSLQRTAVTKLHINDGEIHGFTCTECIATINRQWQQDFKIHLLRMIQEWFRANPDKFKTYIAYTYRNHPKKMKEMGFTLLEGE